MSLQPEAEYLVPEVTSRVARAAFPKGTLCLKIYDELGTIFRDQDFADLFPRRGQPAEAPFRLALVTVLQFAEGLSDRAAADAVRSRIDWKYLLCLELDDPGFDFSVLCEFRGRLLESGAERRLFETLLGVVRDRKLVTARGRQRTDSTHVLGAIRAINRLEAVIETMRHTLNVLATAAPDWVRERLPIQWVDRYDRRADDYRLPKSQTARETYAEGVGADGYRLLDEVYADASPMWLRELPALETLRRVWVQNFRLVEGQARWRASGDIPPSARFIGSPYDIEARYSKKRSTSWVGYKVHVTESCEDDTPNVITDVETKEACSADHDALPEIHEALSAVDLLPDTHLVDTGYVESKSLVASKRDYDVDLFGPPRVDQKWQAKAGEGFEAGRFEIDWDRKKARCPAGKESSSWCTAIDRRDNDVVKIKFARKDCRPCPMRPHCTTAPTMRRTISIRPEAQHVALMGARERQKTEEFKEEYDRRAGVEGTISQGVRAFGMRRSRYMGMAKTRFQNLAIGAAINLVRIAAWLEEVPREVTRRSAFAKVMTPAAA
jgi:transposase